MRLLSGALRRPVLAATTVTLGLLATAAPALATPSHHAASKATTGHMTLVQAVPDTSMTMSVDGRRVKASVSEGGVVGPLSLTPGPHEVTFAMPGEPAITSRVTLATGSTTDVVVHRPAAVNGTPVVNTYQARLSPLGPGKARLMLAHTATVAPADVDFDGTVVFKNIANGEFAQADVPAGSHQVALLPAGQQADPILGPVSVSLRPRTLTMVYAVGRPENGSMKVISHTVTVPADGSSTPRTIKTGSAGLVRMTSIRGFSPTSSPARTMADSASAAGRTG